jgi:hypothetical protein
MELKCRVLTDVFCGGQEKIVLRPVEYRFFEILCSLLFGEQIKHQVIYDNIKNVSTPKCC